MPSPSITIDQVIDALASFITPYCEDAEIIRGQVNRVPMPLGAFVELTEILQADLETPTINYAPDDDEATISTPTRIDIQIDFYGTSSGDMCKAVKTVYRSLFATDAFPDGIKPLYCSDGIQSPLITGEEQYESRWTLTASLQYNALITVAEEFADEATVNETVAADILY